MSLYIFTAFEPVPGKPGFYAQAKYIAKSCRMEKHGLSMASWSIGKDGTLFGWIFDKRTKSIPQAKAHIK